MNQQDRYFILCTNFLYKTSVRHLIRLDADKKLQWTIMNPIIHLKQILMKIPNTRLHHNLFSFRDETCDKTLSVYLNTKEKEAQYSIYKTCLAFQSVIFSQP
jgi:hypothetical protein